MREAEGEGDTVVAMVLVRGYELVRVKPAYVVDNVGIEPSTTTTLMVVAYYHGSLSLVLCSVLAEVFSSLVVVLVVVVWGLHLHVHGEDTAW